MLLHPSDATETVPVIGVEQQALCRTDWADANTESVMLVCLGRSDPP